MPVVRRSAHPRLYLWLRARSLGLHLLFLVIAAGCLMATWWQVYRAAQGNTLSYLYAFEWPVFAVVAGVGWWQLVHDTDEEIVARRAFHERVRAASAEVVARTLPRSARALTVDAVEVEGRSLAPADQPRSLEAGASTGSPGALAVARRGDGALEGRPLPTDPASTGPGPDADPGDDLDAYNRYLAILAVRGRPKTWRNPRGI